MQDLLSVVPDSFYQGPGQLLVVMLSEMLLVDPIQAGPLATMYGSGFGACQTGAYSLDDVTWDDDGCQTNYFIELSKHFNPRILAGATLVLCMQLRPKGTTNSESLQYDSAYIADKIVDVANLNSIIVRRLSMITTETVDRIAFNAAAAGLKLISRISPTLKKHVLYDQSLVNETLEWLKRHSSY